MSNTGDILIVSSDARALDAVRTVIEQRNGLTLRHCQTLAEAPALLAGCAFAAVVVDIDPDPVPLLAELEPIVNEFAASRFMVISSHFSSDLMMEAMSIGARHFLTRNQIDQELPGILDRLLNPPEGRQGALVTVLSSGGGCGATTIAINLARELGSESHPSLVIDLDDAYGAVATCLGLRGKYSFADLLHYKGTLDPQLVATTAMEYDPLLHALLHPASIDPPMPGPMKFTHLEAALGACRHTYRWTVVDAPRVDDELAARLARQSRAVLIVAQQNVKELRRARVMQQRLVEAGVPAETIRCVINRHRSRRCAVSDAEAGKALEGVELLRVRNDYAAAIHSQDMGKPLAVCAPRSKARRDIAAIASALVNLKPPAVRTPGAPGSAADKSRRGLSLVG